MLSNYRKKIIIYNWNIMTTKIFIIFPNNKRECTIEILKNIVDIKWVKLLRENEKMHFQIKRKYELTKK